MNRRFLKLLDWKAGNIYLSLLKYIWDSDVSDYLLRTPLECHIGLQDCFPKWTCHLSFLPARPVASFVTWFGKWHINHSILLTRTLGAKFDSFSQHIPLIILCIYLLSTTTSVHSTALFKSRASHLLPMSLLQQPSDNF